MGLGGGYVLNEGTGYRVYGRDSLQLRSPNVSYGYIDTQAYNQDGHGFGARYSSQRLGQGYDLGFTYEWRPQHAQYQYRMDGTEQDDPAQNKYRLRLGVTLTDLGALRYASERYVHQAALANPRTVQLGQVDTLTFDPLSSMGPTLERLVGLRSQAREFATCPRPCASRPTTAWPTTYAQACCGRKTCCRPVPSAAARPAPWPSYRASNSAVPKWQCRSFGPTTTRTSRWGPWCGSGPCSWVRITWGAFLA